MASARRAFEETPFCARLAAATVPIAPLLVPCDWVFICCNCMLHYDVELVVLAHDFVSAGIHCVLFGIELQLVGVWLCIAKR